MTRLAHLTPLRRKSKTSSTWPRPSSSLRFAAAQRGVDELVELLPAVVQVRPAHDAYGNHGFVPVDEARMGLVDRVLALLVADYLTRPDEFLRDRPSVSGTHSTRPWMNLDLRGAGTG